MPGASAGVAPAAAIGPGGAVNWDSEDVEHCRLLSSAKRGVKGKMEPNREQKNCRGNPSLDV